MDSEYIQKTSKFKYYMPEKNGGYHNEIMSQNMDC